MNKINHEETTIDGNPYISSVEKSFIEAGLNCGFEALLISGNTVMAMGSFISAPKYTHYYDRTQNRFIRRNAFKK